MMRRLALLSALLQVAWSVSLYAQLPADIPVAAQERLDGLEQSGMIVGEINGSEVYFTYYGARNNGTDILTPATIVETGSITKVFTALLYAYYALTGKIKLNAPVTDYLPDTVDIPKYKGTPVTVIDLLSHRSGLPRLPSNLEPADPANPYKEYTAQKLYAFLASYTLKRKPGTKYEYSNLGYALLGLALEHYTQQTYSDLLAQYITGPLGMQSTWIDVPEERKPERAPPMAEHNPVSYWDMNAFRAAGAISSTPQDMVLFIASMLTKNENPFADVNAFAADPMFATDAGFTSIGLGWHINQSENATIVWHNGGTGGFRSFIGYNRKENKGAVVFVNNSAVDPTDIGLHILDPIQKVKRLPQVFEVTNEMLAPYEGSYEILTGFLIKITIEGNKIFAQATGQERFELYAESPIRFNYRVTIASIEFDVNDGVVNGLRLFQNNNELYGKKIQ